MPNAFVNQSFGHIEKTADSKPFESNTLKILKIQRTCVHDGPGIRTTIFFKGCGLRCLWCQNPESLSDQTDLAPDSHYSIPEIMDVVLRDKEYYHATGGGVTLSGGEPLLQNPDDLLQLMELLKKEKIPVAVETSLHVPWENIFRMASYVDLFLVDLKVVGDDDLHMKCTKQDSRLIHENIMNLLKIHSGIKFRVVIVPGYNDDPENIAAAADFLKSNNHNAIELLKYHNMYEGKHEKLRLPHKSLGITSKQSLAAVKNAVKSFEALGIRAECTDLFASPQKAVFTKRVYDIQNAIRESDRHLCLEASKLKTDFYKKEGFNKSTHLHRGKRLAHVLKNKKITIYPDELLVGNFTSHRVGGQIWEEHYGVLHALILHQIHRQKPIAFQCPLKDKLLFYFKIVPFWLKRCLITKVHSSFSKKMLLVARGSEMNTGFNNNMSGIAHFVVNFERVLQLGITGLIEEIKAKQIQMPENKKDFYDGMIITLQGLEAFADRYANALSIQSRETACLVRKKELEKMAEICKHVPKHPARSFHEALQAMLFLQIALCLESFENAVSHGRLDQVLSPYYEKDKAEEVINFDKAKELLALYILKMDEAILVNDGDTYMRIGRLFETMSTDQAVTFGGVGKNGEDANNEVTDMLLDICELQPYAVNMTARIHENSPAEYLKRISEIYIAGAPMPALYNDTPYIKTLTKHYDTTIEQARNYSIVGCVEPNASDDHYGNTDCANMNVALPFLQALKGEEHDLWNYGAFDQMEKLTTKFVEYNFSGNGLFRRFVSKRYGKARQRFLAKRAIPPQPPASMEELLDRFQQRLNHLAASVLADHQAIEAQIRKHFTTPLTSSLFEGCLESGKDVNEGGATLNSCGIQAVGITDVADSLFAINEIVFKRKLYTIDDIIKAIEHDFEGDYYQEIQLTLLGVPKFGQDESHEAVQWVNRVLQIYVNALKSVENCPRGGIYAAGYYALNVNDVYGKKTPSLPSGRLKGVSLANSITPHYGMQMGDLLSALNSVAGVDYVSYAPNGTTVTFTIDSALFQGTEGIGNLSGIIRTFFQKGGMQFQPNVINRDILLDAYNHPEKHPYLLVRVAGYCAYFNDLSDDLKKIIINRTCYS